MFKRLFGASLPEPNQEQLKTVLHCTDCSLDSEIISIAYEPRFQLTAFGTTGGQLYVMNASNQVFKSDFGSKAPILQLIPLVNSASFLGVCSRTLFLNHPNIKKKEHQGLKGLSTLSQSSVRSMLMYWMITPEKIIPKCLVIDKDILAVAVSPTSPNYAIVATETGALMGFSIEDMKFTRLYIDNYIGKPIRTLFCERGLSFYVCSDKIDRVDVQHQEYADFASFAVQRFDKLDDHAAGIDVDGVPTLYYSIFGSFRRGDGIELPAGSFGAFTSMIEKDKWLSIVRRAESDIVYVGTSEKFGGQYFVPGIVVKYEDPYKRSGVKEVFVMSEFGRTVDIEGKASADHFPMEKFESQFASCDDGVIRLFNEKQIFEIRNQSFCGVYSNNIGIPLAIVNKKAIVLENMADLCSVDVETGDKVVIETLAVHRVHKTTTRIDFICEEAIKSLDLTKTDELTLFDYTEFYPEEGVKTWVKYRDAFAFITTENVLVFKEHREEVCEPGEQILLCEVVGDDGKLSETAEGYIVIVSAKSVVVYHANDGKLTRVRKEKTHGKAREASLFNNGTLVIRTKKSCSLHILPDITYDPVWRVDVVESAALIPRHGFVLSGHLTFSLHLIDPPEKCIYNQSVPSLELPKDTGLRSLFASKTPTMREVDTGFQNPKYRKGLSSLSQATAVMQHNLLIAQERGELLNEMAVKSEQIRDGAHKFRDLAKELAEKNWWF